MRFSKLGLSLLGGGLLALAGCSTYSDPVPPADAHPVVTGADSTLTAGGIDHRFLVGGRFSGMSGGTDNTMENRMTGWQKAMGVGGSGQPDTMWNRDWEGSTPHAANMVKRVHDQGEDRTDLTRNNAHHVFAPSDHVLVGGVDTGPTTQHTYVSSVFSKP